MDVPLTPQAAGSRSLHAYISHVTDEMVQRERDQILDAGQEDIRALAPMVRCVLDQNYLCVVGSEGKLKKQSDLFARTEKLAE